MHLTETIVATAALTIFTAVSLQSFTSSMKVVGSSKLRDQVSVAITADLGKIRRTADEWQIDQSTIDAEGLTVAAEINYTPTTLMCENGTIALDFLKDGDQFPQEEYGALSETTSDWRRVKTDILTDNAKVSLTRTVSSESTNENLLKVSYTIDSSVLANSNSTSYIVMPAQAWCNA